MIDEQNFSQEALESYKLCIKKALRVHTKCKPTILIKGDTFFVELWLNSVCVYKAEVHNVLNEIRNGRTAQRIAFDLQKDFKKQVLSIYFR